MTLLNSTSTLLLGPALMDHLGGAEEAPSQEHPGGTGLVFACTAALLDAHAPGATRVRARVRRPG